jgi:hypothetical protein
MDALLATLAPTESSANALAWAVKAFRDDRANLYREYRQYLAGDHPLAFATPKFRSAFGQIFREFAYNRCGTVVDAHADRLRVAGFGSSDDDARREARERGEQLDDTTQTVAQLAQDLWDANLMDIHEGSVEVEALGLGDAYLLVEVNPITGAVQVWPQEADLVRVHYDPDQPGVRDLGAKAWHDEDEHMRLNIYFKNRIEKYRTLQRARSGMPSSIKAFEPFQPDTDTAWPVMLPFDDTMPIFHLANNGRINRYGESELQNVLRLQDGLNKTLMDMLITMEFAAFPQRVLINVDVEDDATADTIQRFQAAVDRLMVLTSSGEGKPPSISEFTAANITQYLDVAESWDVRISRVTKVPVHYLTMQGDFPSGAALRMAEAPFTAKIEDRQRAFGAVYTSAIEYGLRLQNVPVQPGDLRVNWESAAPMGDEDTWSLAQQKRDVGMPFPAVLREMGYEPEQIQQVQEEKDAETEAMAIADFGGDDREEGRVA